MNIGMNTPLMKAKESQKWILPSVSFIFLPVTFGYQ